MTVEVLKLPELRELQADVVRVHRRNDEPGNAVADAATGEVVAKKRERGMPCDVQQARATASTGSVRVARDMNNHDVAVVYARVPGPGWLVFVELPVDEWTKN